MTAQLRVRITPADVGSRVSVRVRADADAAEAFTDVVGDLESWQRGRLRIRRRDGAVATVDADRLVAGKRVPPPPPRRRR